MHSEKPEAAVKHTFTFTVSELTKHIKDTLESVYPDVWVEGEISNLRTPSSGHSYFTLKDEHSQLRAVMFRLQSRLLRFMPEDGLKVICRGRINVYEPRGEYQLLVELMEPRGVGDLQLAFEQLKKKLRQEGLFAEEHKKPLPFLPRRIAVITSPTGAAVRDIINIITRRFSNVELLILPVKVQGDEAPAEIAAALRTADQHTLADVVILARGGGSLEDLWAFNTEQVARAIFDCRIPVIAAVGHEIDVTIADFVADLRAPTPSAAAELAVREKKELLQLLAHAGVRLKNLLSQAVERTRTRAEHLSGRLHAPLTKLADYQLRHDDSHLRLVQTLTRFIALKKTEVRHAHKNITARTPAQAVAQKRIQVHYLARELAGLVRSAGQTKRSLLHTAAARLNALNPLYALERGFSITRIVPSMEIARDAAQLAPGDRVNVRLGKGAIDCRVEKVLQ